MPVKAECGVLWREKWVEWVLNGGPSLPVLLISGYGSSALASRAAAGVTRVLTKPLQRAALARVLAEVLR